MQQLKVLVLFVSLLAHAWGLLFHEGHLVMSTADCKERGQEEWFCTERYDPVCGIDGKTYPSCCFARVYGVKYVTSHTACQTADGQTLPPVAFLEQFGVPSPEDEEEIRDLSWDQQNITNEFNYTEQQQMTGSVLEQPEIDDQPFEYFRITRSGKALLEWDAVEDEITLDMFKPYVSDFNLGVKKENGRGIPQSSNFSLVENLAQNFDQEEILIGDEDTRVAINDSTSTPFSAIGQLQVGCTAALIGSRYVITAAHCILDRFDRELRDLDFTPAKNGHFEPYGKFEWFNFFLPKAWVENKTASADFAVIMYKNRIADLVGGYLDLQVDCAKELYILNVAGYPSDKTPEGSLYATSCQGVELRCTDMTLIHTCDTFGGMSGAPMISYRKDQDPAFAIRAIHTGGNRQLQLNFGTNITPKIKETINSWIQQAERNFAPLLDYVVSNDAIQRLNRASGD
eukprot:TRINITY_DN3444_c0_g1_i1.p1 TRINITY_DN3444_c0_g1~~TRINITY_DN3444_c0_g1_i1.p1  ORF type:complete len:456 (-),score=42.58 TRINITY_DN3444_c0_g1_i1:695-2062(-)